MGRNKNLSAEDIRLDALVRSEYKKSVAAKQCKEQIEEIIRHAEANVEDFPDDKEDERRRFMEIMREMRAQGQLTADEQRQVFGDEADKTGEGTGCETKAVMADASGAYEETADGEDKIIKFAGDKANKSGKVVEMSKRRRFFRTLGKGAAIVAVICAGMFTLSMTSQANRQYFTDTVSYLMGKDTRVNVNSDNGALIRGVSESEARMDIAEELNVSVPTLGYKPDQFWFEGYECYSDYGYAIIHYQLNESEVLFYIANKDGQKVRTALYDGKSLETIHLNRGQVEAKLYMSNDEDVSPTFGADWEHENAYYRFNGKMEKEEFEKIIKKIYY